MTDGPVALALIALETKLQRRLRDKGRGTFASRHEVLGIVAEEYQELIDAVQSEPLTNVEQELLDIAVGCVFGVACIRAGTLEW